MAFHWSIHQLTEYLVAVSGPSEFEEAATVALERVIEALEAELGVVVVADRVVGSAGFGGLTVPQELMNGRNGDVVTVPGLGDAHLICGRLDTPDSRAGTAAGRLVVGRLAEAGTPEEHQMLQGMALALGLRLQGLETLAAERRRHRLVETLLRIQRTVSARRPLTEILDGVTAGASALLDGSPVALFLASKSASEPLRHVSGHAFRAPDTVIHDLAHRAPGESGTMSADGVLAERVVVDDEAVGCLVAQSRPGLGYDPGELLSAFAQQVNLALTDARTQDAVREAHRDPVTGLPNRALFLERLVEERATAVSRGHDLTVLFIDLDRFKAVNDTLGHGAGDQLLAEVAHRIVTCVGDRDVVARLGGDEFAVLLHKAGSTMGGSIAQRIITSLAGTFRLGGREVLIGASVGVSTLSSAAQSATSLLSDADVAMYCAKRSGRGRWVCFAPHMHEDVANQLGLRSDLRHALAGEELWLAYQPLMVLSTFEVVGLETLLRWSHPTRGAVPPSDFIPIAEESDTIFDLGAYTIERGLAQLACWRQDRPDLNLALNVSARQVTDPRLPRLLREVLAATGVPGEAVTVEITESVLMADPTLARVGLMALADQGIRLSIDDFGTGYSSLSYLRQFPVDQVKIDRSFVAGLRPDAHDEIALVASILDLCRALRLQTVAEGIEDHEQMSILRDLGCDLGQGYFISRPLPAEGEPHRVPMQVYAH
jgi:diguanylate cyclase (GGDEF)-like protein